MFRQRQRCACFSCIQICRFFLLWNRWKDRRSPFSCSREAQIQPDIYFSLNKIFLNCQMEVSPFLSRIHPWVIKFVGLGGDQVPGRPGTRTMKMHILNGRFKLGTLLVQFAQPDRARRLSGLHSLGHWCPKVVLQWPWIALDFQVALEMPAWPSSQQTVGCHRPCFKSRVDLWSLASTALVKSSLFLLLLPSAGCVSSYGCLGSWPQKCTWEASGSQQCMKAHTCPQDPVG